MEIHLRNILINLLIIKSFVVCENKVRPKCAMDQPVCEFYLVLEEHRMMTLRTYTSQHTSTEEPVVFYPNGTGAVQDRTQCENEYPLLPEDFDRVPTGDGSYKFAYLFNGSYPGPPIIVYQGQKVVVHVTNKLINEGTTVHWHGLALRNTPWMDGVAMVSQCPINPGETFTYRFLAAETGTYWYHSHYGVQRTMGAHGALIILDKTKQDEQNRRGNDPLPEFEDEFYLIVSDIFENSSLEVAQIVQREAVSYFHGWDVPVSQCFNSTKQPDGVDCGVIPFQSGVINGKGHHYKEESDIPENPGLPLERFIVSKNKRYRFRMISSSMTYIFRVSIDGHMLNVIASDGNDMRTTRVESIIIASGERYDFWIETNDPDNLANYWIRATTIEMYQNDKPMTPNHVEAILQYTGSQAVDPVSTRRPCTVNDACLLLNCPFRYYAPGVVCLPTQSLKNTQATPEMKLIQPEQGEDIEEFFFNFHFTGFQDAWKTTVNGIQHRAHSAPPQIYPSADKQKTIPCDDNSCWDGLCRCTHMMEVPLGKIVQMVLFITIKNPVGVLNGNPHNIHLHGNTFQVVKVGYASYNDKGIYEERNKDIRCFGEFCNEATWSDPSWSNGNLPGLNTAPPLKDTVIIPVGGYVVIRFRADNPGYWYMHCHTEFHNEEGMALLLKVGDEKEMNAAPKDMNQCGNFDWTNEEFLGQVNANSTNEDIKVITDDCNVTLYTVLTVVFMTLTSVLFVSNIILGLHRSRRQTSGYTYIPSNHD